MARPRKLRRLLLLATLVSVIFLAANLVYFRGIDTENIKNQLEENLKELDPQLSEIKAELNDLRIPGLRKKPWHSEEKPEQPTEPHDNHPIATLMQEADKAFRNYESGRSKSFRETVRNYRRKYGRHPPPGFKEWYKFARKRNVHNIDDFEQIMDDLRPFWAVEPRVIRELAGTMWRDKTQGISGIHIRDHKVVRENNEGWRSNALVKLIKRFVKHLPDMDICMNSLDQPRVVVPWDDMQALLEKEAQSRRTPPETVYEFTEAQGGLANVSTPEAIAEAHNSTEDPGWYAWHGKQYMDVVKTACPPGSPAADTGTTMAEAENIYKSNLGGLITNFNLSTDLCTVGPQLADKHGMLFTSSTMIPTKRLVPIFGECKVSVNSDILFPANMYWLHDKRYDYDGAHDVDWLEKRDAMIWRGVTSGGTQVATNWHSMHRQRLVTQVNATVMADQTVKVLSEAPERPGQYENHRNFAPSTFLANHTDVGFTEAWGCIPDCSFYDDVFSLKAEMPIAQQFEDKLVVDVDGHSFSGRWHAFLESRSLGVKATIFREWHDSRLFAWRHFVPMDNRYDDIYTLLTYFFGVQSTEGTGPVVPRHDEEGKRIAEQGREWAKKVLRRDDIEIYMFRLLLEYGRIIDDNRDRIGYSEDGSELDKWDGISPTDEIAH